MGDDASLRVSTLVPAEAWVGRIVGRARQKGAVEPSQSRLRDAAIPYTSAEIFNLNTDESRVCQDLIEDRIAWYQWASTTFPEEKHKLQETLLTDVKSLLRGLLTSTEHGNMLQELLIAEKRERTGPSGATQKMGLSYADRWAEKCLEEGGTWEEGQFSMENPKGHLVDIHQIKAQLFYSINAAAAELIAKHVPPAVAKPARSRF